MSLHLKKMGPETATKTLLFLHGLGVSSWMWEDQLAGLQQEYQCLAIDLPGNGDSYTTEWLSFADTADQLAAIIRQHAVAGKVHVIGLSLGGYTALHLLKRHPELIASTLVSGVTATPFSNLSPWRGLVKITPIVLKWNPVIKLAAKMMQLPPEVAELFARDNKRLSALTYRRVYNEVFNFSLPAELALPEHRLLALAGDREANAVKNSLVEFSRRIPGAITALVPEAHHAWNAEHPQLFTATVRAWVENQPLPEKLAVTPVQTLAPVR